MVAKYKLLMDIASAVGTRLAAAGAETYRVEESVIRILRAYGYEAKVYSVPNSLIISIDIPGELPVTSLFRIKNRGNDLEAVEQYSNLSRQICAQTPDPEEAMKWIDRKERSLKKYSLPMQFLGSYLVAAGFCVFFGGSLRDALFAGLCGVVLCLFSAFLERIGAINIFLTKISAAFVMGMTAYALYAVGMIVNVDAAIIGTLMLLVPGLLFTNALRDVIFGDTNSGVNKTVEVLLIAAAVAMGTVAAGSVADTLFELPACAANNAYAPWITCIAGFIACVGFVIVFNIHGYGNMLCALGGGITWAIYCIAAALGGGEHLCCFVATVGAAIFAEWMARLRKYPAISYLVISLLPLIPGAGIYYTASYAFQRNWEGFQNQGFATLLTAGVMAIGILLVSSTVRVLTSNRDKRYPVDKPQRK